MTALGLAPAGLERRARRPAPAPDCMLAALPDRRMPSDSRRMDLPMRVRAYIVRRPGSQRMLNLAKLTTP